METAEIELAYLEKVLAFKNRTDLNSEFLDPKVRRALLREVFNELDLKENLWMVRQEKANLFFHMFNQFKRDDPLREIVPKTYDHLCESYVLKAISLDPYNQAFLEAYIKLKGKSKAQKSLVLRYLNLFHPTSVEYQNTAIDFKLKQDFSDCDYLAEEVIKPLVNWIIDYQKKEVEKTVPLNQDELEQLAISGGIDKESIAKTKKLVPSLLETAHDALQNHWLTYDVSMKSAIAMETALKYAPYDRETVELGVEFYGSLYWRLFLNFSKLRSNTTKREFYEFMLNTKKPNNEALLEKAEAYFTLAESLKNRLKLIPEKKGAKNNIFGKYASRSIIKRNRINGIEGVEYEDQLPNFAEGIIEKERICFKIAKEVLSIKEGINRTILIISPVVFCFMILGYFLLIGLPDDEIGQTLISAIFVSVFVATAAGIGLGSLLETRLKKRIFMP